MSALWGSLTPLILGSALVPIQIMITLLLLRSKSGKWTAVAFIMGLTIVRLIQGAIFGLVLSRASNVNTDTDGPGLVLSMVLLLLGIVFLATAAKTALTHEDPDAPPPKWLTMTESMKPMKAFLIGLVMLSLQPKFWILTLGAISAVGSANLGQPRATVMFLIFIALAESLSIVAVAYSFIAPRQSAVVLERAVSWLTRRNRLIMMVLGVIFGVWFALKGLGGLGV